MELTLAPLVRPGLFRSSEAIRAKIRRGTMRRGVHWFQKAPGARIYVDLEACEALARTDALVGQPPDGDLVATSPAGAIPLARGGWLR